MLKRYLVFGGKHYYPNGGFGDLITFFEDKEEAKNEVASQLRNEKLPEDNDWVWFDWGQVVDIETGNVWHYTGHKLEGKDEWEYKWTDGADKSWTD